MSYYRAEVVNLSLKNVNVINNYKTIDIKMDKNHSDVCSMPKTP